MLNREQAQRTILTGGAVSGIDGLFAGRISHIYFDTTTSRLAWAGMVRLPGGQTTLIPLADAMMHEDELVTPYTHADIAAAPPVHLCNPLDETELTRASAHYGLPITLSWGATLLPVSLDQERYPRWLG